MRVLVLGAGGFIGQRIVAATARRYGIGSVVAGVRSPRRAATGVEQRIVDAEDRASVEAALSDITHVVNSVMGSDHAIVGSARHVAEAVRSGKIERAVHLSSIAVYGHRDGLVREGDPLGPPVDGYAAAKIEAEAFFTHLAGERGVILRPGLVHGAGSALWTMRIGRLVASGRLGPMGRSGEGTCGLVHVDDVADATVSALDAPEAGGRSFTLVAAPAPSWNAYLADVAAAIDVPIRPLSAARLGFERLLAYPITAWRRAVGGGAPEAITPGLARLFNLRATYESSAIGPLLPRWRDYREHLSESLASGAK